jgi:hypothetical protein
MKELDHDADTWWDHDPDCHGDPHDLVDDFDYADGFVWSCCEKRGSRHGCKSTKHQSETNVIVPKPKVPAPPPPNRKRKAEEAIQRPMYVRCENCRKRFDIYDNQKRTCVYHPGKNYYLPNVYLPCH